VLGLRLLWNLLEVSMLQLKLLPLLGLVVGLALDLSWPMFLQMLQGPSWCCLLPLHVLELPLW
jgi:hypothetical protein